VAGDRNAHGGVFRELDFDLSGNIVTQRLGW